ncbi:putative Bromodomain testis-specific protein [Xylariomycetidae sp. FL0641]|nr:putative Bromodomain testis-specific protein [Xylariomycetidae sp. FL0641]
MASEIGEAQAPAPFSWTQPHMKFVAILVGEQETPFGIQKDFLCAKSSYYRQLFASRHDEIESLEKLPNTTPEVFGLAQNFMYTGSLYSEVDSPPGYEVLIDTWKIGHELGIEGLCDEALEAMAECRRLTQLIPSTPLLVRAWKETPEGSTIRKLLLTWAAEYIRSSESRSEFSKSLPQEVLSELVVAMSHLNSAPVIQVNSVSSPGGQTQRKNVHYLDAEDSEGEPAPKATKQRHSDVGSARTIQVERAKPGPKKGATRTSLPAVAKPPKAKRTSIHVVDEGQFTNEQKMMFCDNLLRRMQLGPGYWTRLVGPFKKPVRPVEDNVPDYLERITRPMDLDTIQAKMDRGEYTTPDEFADDVRLIAKNCHTYWDDKPVAGATILSTCSRFEKHFDEKFGDMHKWLAKYAGNESA